MLWLAGLSFAAIMGTITFVTFSLFIVVEFLNVANFLKRLKAKLYGHEEELDSGTVDRSLGLMDRQPGEYAATRNAKQEARRGK